MQIRGELLITLSPEAGSQPVAPSVTSNVVMIGLLRSSSGNSARWSSVASLRFATAFAPSVLELSPYGRSHSSTVLPWLVVPTSGHSAM